MIFKVQRIVRVAAFSSALDFIHASCSKYRIVFPYKDCLIDYSMDIHRCLLSRVVTSESSRGNRVSKGEGPNISLPVLQAS